MRRRAAMAQRCPFAAGENGSKPPSLPADVSMSEGVYASVDAMQTAGAGPVLDPISVDPCCHELHRRQNSLLPCSDLGGLSVWRGDFVGHRHGKATQAAIRPRVDSAAPNDHSLTQPLLAVLEQQR